MQLASTLVHGGEEIHLKEGEDFPQINRFESYIFYKSHADHIYITHSRCEWVNVSFGTGSPRLSWTKSSVCVYLIGYV